MIVLHSPKGWTGPKEIKGHKVEGSWRSHQVPFSDVRDNPANLKLLEDWMRSYKPEELFDAAGRFRPELKALAPKGARRMSANPHANGGLLRKDLRLPDFRNYAVKVPQAGKVLHENTKPLGEFLRDVMKNNMTNFRVFGPDETPPATTVSLNPTSPDGSAGWYVSNVHATVSASDAGGSGVAETRCVLDPASVPAAFDDIPAGCAFTSTGADVTGDGQHTLYAASKDNADNTDPRSPAPTSTLTRRAQR